MGAYSSARFTIIAYFAILLANFQSMNTCLFLNLNLFDVDFVEKDNKYPLKMTISALFEWQSGCTSLRLRVANFKLTHKMLI